MVVIRGRFGKCCSECDNIIPRERLRAQPKAKRCIECETIRENKRTRAMRIAERAIRDQDVVIIKG